MSHRDLLQDFVDKHNFWGRYQKRLCNRAGNGARLLPVITQKEFRRQVLAKQIKDNRVERAVLKRTEELRATKCIEEKESK